MSDKIPFIPGKPVIDDGPLSRFLPPIPEGIATSWLREHFPGGSLIFDPFGASPRLTTEIAQAGYKVLTCVNNPVTRLLLTLAAHPPREEDCYSALAELARSRVGDERLEIHLKNLYQTVCSQCGHEVVAEAFIWDREAKAPYAKIYECTHCGDSGEHPVNQTDIDLARRFPADSMHRLRIIEHITKIGEKERINVNDALTVYLPRAVYGLVTLINRLEGLLVAPYLGESPDPGRVNCLTGLVLCAMDKANNLWSYPSGRSRPKQLSSSPIFREVNIWFALENAVKQLSHAEAPVELTNFPEFPHENGICLFGGPLRSLQEQLTTNTLDNNLEIGGVVSAVPRHNQAFWTLSALWAGWLFGRESISEFKSVLHRRRYDWAWHCSALSSAFDSIVGILGKKTRMLGIITEAETSFLQSAVVAAGHSGIKLQEASIRVDSQQAQLHWEFTPDLQYQIPAPFLVKDQLREKLINQGLDTLRQRAEPAPYLTLCTSALTSLSENMGLVMEINSSPGEDYYRVQTMLENSFTYKNGFVRHGGSEKSLENTILWHQEIIEPRNMLSDRVESQILELLVEQEIKNYYQLDHEICYRFPGFFTPDSGLINHCIESYSKKEELARGIITLREQDQPAKRSLEVSATGLSLHDLGSRLGYSTRGSNPVIWETSDGLLSYVFNVTSSAQIGNLVFNPQYPANKSIIVIPGARANLLLYKLRHNFLLAQVINQGWRFLKFRHLRHLLDTPTISSNNFDQELALDPMTESPAQMRLL